MLSACVHFEKLYMSASASGAIMITVGHNDMLIPQQERLYVSLPLDRKHKSASAIGQNESESACQILAKIQYYVSQGVLIHPAGKLGRFWGFMSI